LVVALHHGLPTVLILILTDQAIGTRLLQILKLLTQGRTFDGRADLSTAALQAAMPSIISATTKIGFAVMVFSSFVTDGHRRSGMRASSLLFLLPVTGGTACDHQARYPGTRLDAPRPEHFHVS
jgi:hypothetical protein